jgi:alpha-galactosidase
MEGHAQVSTFPAIAKDPKTIDMYKDMVDLEGKPITCDDVWIAYSYGDFYGEPVGTKSGKLSAGWGSQHHVGTGKIGPEFTFGIYMNKMLGEPILLIKTAWGGKSLKVDFRPPSGGPLVDAKDKEKEKVGRYYGLMMDYVKQVLTDPKKVYPGYDPKSGYEVAGFVWFQGFNDLVGNYPSTDASKGKKGVKDYSEYSRLLACLIRDVRKDLSAPNLPFVIGVLGVGGADAGENTFAFRKAMAAPAEMAEFKGSVVNVFTEKFWPAELDAILAKAKPIRDAFKKKEGESTGKKSGRAELAGDDELNAQLSKVLTADELFLLNNGISNQGFHYHGSAKFFAQAGKAFAEALVDLKKNVPAKQ